MSGIQQTTLVVIDTDYIGSYKSTIIRSRPRLYPGSIVLLMYTINILVKSKMTSNVKVINWVGKNVALWWA